MNVLSELAAHQKLAVVLTLSSVAMFVGSVLAVPWLIARAPHDFFARDERVHKRQTPLPLKLLKNAAGVVLVTAGVAMLVLPGQGILTLIVGVSLLDVPGKHAALVLLARRPGVMRALNYVRRRAKRAPFEPPDHS